jgi:hypothetical protein
LFVVFIVATIVWSEDLNRSGDRAVLTIQVVARVCDSEGSDDKLFLLLLCLAIDGRDNSMWWIPAGRLEPKK